MGHLVDGEWEKSGILERSSSTGSFKRADPAFREWLGSDDFPFEKGRYRLYVSHACPWSHRATIFRVLKKLENAIPLIAVQPHMGECGWKFDGKDEQTGAQYMYELYQRAKPDYTGSVTVPVLWDTQKETIVSNESADIIRMFNELGDDETDYYPKELRKQIDAINEDIYHQVNNGVYKAGFATNQQAYDEAIEVLFEMLDRLENRLTMQRYLVEETLTEADWRLFVTLVRFDTVYVNHFNCNICRIADYRYLSEYLARLYMHPGIEQTVKTDEIKAHYFTSHPELNPQGIIPAGPTITPDILGAVA